MNPRDRRLNADARKVRELSEQSDLIDVSAVDETPGRPPEVWEVTYRCKGVVGRNADGSPVYGDYHRVRIELGRDYPLAPPAFRWLTPILHPNIEGREPHRVCIDQAHWHPGRHLDAVVLMMGEMVQYKNYHSDVNVAPYPMDHDAARWAQQAERSGYFSKSNPVDPRPLLRPAVDRLDRTPDAGARPGRIRVVRSNVSAPDGVTERPSRVRITRADP